MLPASFAKRLSSHARARRSFSTSTSLQDKVYKFGNSMGPDTKEEEKLLEPTLVPEFTRHRVKQVSAGWIHTLIATGDGLAFGWGTNDFGQLGVAGLRQRHVGIPEWLHSLQPVKIVKTASGRTHSLFLTDSGQVMSVGGLEFGQLGDGKMEKAHRDVPSRIENLFGKKVVDISVGLDHSLALTDSGEVYTWGFNREGQLGIGDEVEDLAYPTEVEGIKHKIVKVCAGLDYSMALTSNGDYYAWGLGEMWQLGNVERDVKSRPILVQHSQKFIELATAGVSVLGLTEKGEVYSWGTGGNGRLGHGDEMDQPKPKPIDVLYGDKKIVQIAGKGGHHLALASDGTVYSWGLGRSGRLGQNGEHDLFSPTPIAFFKGKKAKHIAAGLDHSIVVTEE